MSMRVMGLKALLLVLLLGVLYAPVRCEEGEDGESDYGGQEDDEEDSLSTEQLDKMFAKFDLNGDGKASMEEIMDFAGVMSKKIAGRDIETILEEIDNNKDGSLSLEEHLNDMHNQADGGDEQEMKELAARKEVETLKFKAADLNHDGVLSTQELPALFYPETHEGVLTVTVEESMKLKDANKDGKLTPQEFWETEDLEGDSAELSEEENADFARLDENHDGFLDATELRHWESGRFHTREAMKKLFDIADKDSDMHVTADELRSAAAEIATSDAQYHLIEWNEHHEL